MRAVLNAPVSAAKRNAPHNSEKFLPGSAEDLLARSEHRRWEDRARLEIELCALKADVARKSKQEAEIYGELERKQRAEESLKEHVRSLRQMLHDASAARQENVFQILEEAASDSEEYRFSTSTSTSPTVSLGRIERSSLRHLDEELKDGLEELRAIQPLVTPVKATSKVWSHLKDAFSSIAIPAKPTLKLLQHAKCQMLKERTSIAVTLRELQYHQLRIIKKMMEAPKQYQDAKYEARTLSEQLAVSTTMFKVKSKEFDQLELNLKELQKIHQQVVSQLSETNEKLLQTQIAKERLDVELQTSSESASTVIANLKEKSNAQDEELRSTVAALAQAEKRESQTRESLQQEIEELKNAKEIQTVRLEGLQNVMKATSRTLADLEDQMAQTKKDFEKTVEMLEASREREHLLQTQLHALQNVPRPNLVTQALRVHSHICSSSTMSRGLIHILCTYPSRPLLLESSVHTTVTPKQRSKGGLIVLTTEFPRKKAQSVIFALHRSPVRLGIVSLKVELRQAFLLCCNTTSIFKAGDESLVLRDDVRVIARQSPTRQAANIVGSPITGSPMPLEDSFSYGNTDRTMSRSLKRTGLQTIVRIIQSIHVSQQPKGVIDDRHKGSLSRPQLLSTTAVSVCLEPKQPTRLQRQMAEIVSIYEHPEHITDLVSGPFQLSPSRSAAETTRLLSGSPRTATPLRQLLEYEQSASPRVAVPHLPLNTLRRVPKHSQVKMLLVTTPHKFSTVASPVGNFVGSTVQPWEGVESIAPPSEPLSLDFAVQTVLPSRHFSRSKIAVLTLRVSQESRGVQVSNAVEENENLPRVQQMAKQLEATKGTALLKKRFVKRELNILKQDLTKLHDQQHLLEQQIEEKYKKKVDDSLEQLESALRSSQATREEHPSREEYDSLQAELRVMTLEMNHRAITTDSERELLLQQLQEEQAEAQREVLRRAKAEQALKDLQLQHERLITEYVNKKVQAELRSINKSQQTSYPYLDDFEQVAQVHTPRPTPAPLWRHRTSSTEALVKLAAPTKQLLLSPLPDEGGSCQQLLADLAEIRHLVAAPGQALLTEKIRVFLQQEGSHVTEV